MNMTHKQKNAAHSLTWVLGLFIAVSVSACGDDASGVKVSSTPCESSTECTDEGGICIAGTCKECVDDSSCTDDPAYGAGSTCNAGACVTCEGDAGCACGEGDTCNTGFCIDGVCNDCTTGEEGCVCFGNDTCNAGQRCDTDAGVCESCPVGEEGCACDDAGLCGDELVCAEDVCVQPDCQAGTLDCPCDEDETCDEGLTCADNNMCAECSSDIVGCACDENDECQNDLVCDEDDSTCREATACADAGCVDNQECEQEDGIDAVCLPSCLSGFTWNSGTSMCDAEPDANCQDGEPGSIAEECAAANKTCNENAGGASCGSCLTGYIEDETNPDECRAWLTCLDLDCASDNRVCDESSTGDASCGACEEDFTESNGVCERGATGNCVDGDPDSILLECMGLNRVCQTVGENAYCAECEDGYTENEFAECIPEVNCADLDCGDRGRECLGEPLAYCGDCVTGTVLSDANDPDSDCRLPYTCDDLDCADGTFCEPGQDGGDAACVDWPCLNEVTGEPDYNMAKRRDNNTCVSCEFSCGRTGETGGFYPYTLQDSDRCACETESGYYWDDSASAARPCDADGDGWVREEAKAATETQPGATEPDQTLVETAKCDFRTIDRFVLKNEWQQELEVEICVDGYVPVMSCTDNIECNGGDPDASYGQCFNNVCRCAEATTVVLVEGKRNDDQATLEGDGDVPLIQTTDGGRKPHAEEVNSLTRGCVTETGDINGNGISDVAEYHGIADNSFSTEQAVFANFTYFMELHRSYYRRGEFDQYGAYVIEERSRTEADFPLQYDSTFDSGPYWQQCTRSRDSDYDMEATQIGFEFGQYSCTETSGTCDILDPVVDTSTDAGQQAAPHGLGDTALPPTYLDGSGDIVEYPWRGMNHHSQFKCKVIDPELPDSPEDAPHIITKDDLHDGFGTGLLQFNSCRVSCPDGDTDCRSDCYEEDPDNMGATGCTDDTECNLDDGFSCYTGTGCFRPKACAVTSTAPEAGLDESVNGSDANPSTVNLTCSPIGSGDVTTDDVGFVSVRYDGDGSYRNGCINEASFWQSLCPGYDDDPGAVVVQANSGNFGSMVCGCGENFGGVGCKEGCTTVMFGGNASDVDMPSNCNNGYCPVTSDGRGRQGYWLCADFSSTAYTGESWDDDLGQVSTGTSNGQSVTISGEVPKSAITREKTCATDGNGNEICIY